MTDTAPLTKTLSVPVQPQATANADLNTILGVADFAATVTAVTYTPLTTVTGAATNNRTITLVNKKGDGTGTTTVASLTFGNGTNANAADETPVTLSGTAANLQLAAGDVLEWTSTHNASGLADPGGVVRVSLSRN